jgi:hypothetical protein
MANSIDNTEDNIQVTDIFERFEELESERDDFTCVIDDEDATPDEVGAARLGLAEWYVDNLEELKALESLIGDLQGMGGDEQWRGDWYPANLIRYSAFENAMDEMVADCYEIPELPSFMTVTLDYVALRQDYSSVDVFGIEYICR